MSSSPPPQGLTSLAPVSRNGRSLAPVASAGSSSLVMLADAQSAAAEAYRSLAATLQFAHADRQLRTIGLTSAAPGEGKSIAAANLAIALAEGGRRVLLIDADLRRPEQHRLFGLDAPDGLSSLLHRDLTTLGDQVLLPLVETPAAGVRLLGGGAAVATPLELLASARFDAVCAAARAQADFVVVDMAPAGALADAAVLAPRLDGVLLVVSAGHTRRDQARRARTQLDSVGAHLLGVVLVEVRGEDKLYTY